MWVMPGPGMLDHSATPLLPAASCPGRDPRYVRGLGTLPASSMFIPLTLIGVLTNEFWANGYPHDFSELCVISALEIQKPIGGRRSEMLLGSVKRRWREMLRTEAERTREEKHMTPLHWNFPFFGHPRISITITIHLK